MATARRIGFCGIHKHRTVSGACLECAWSALTSWCFKTVVGSGNVVRERSYTNLNNLKVEDVLSQPMPHEPNAQQPDGGAEDAFDKWIHEDHFGVGCEIGMNDTAHSEECVEAAFKDGYAVGQRANTPSASPEREAVYRAVDAFLNYLEGIAKRDGVRAWTVMPVAQEIVADEGMRTAFQSYFFHVREAAIAAHKESRNG